MHAVLNLFDCTAIYVIRHGAFGLCARPSKDHAFSGSASLRHMCTLHAKDHACLFRQCLTQAQDIVDVALCTLPREARASRARLFLARARANICKVCCECLKMLARPARPARGFARPARPARVVLVRARSSRSVCFLCRYWWPKILHTPVYGHVVF